MKNILLILIYLLPLIYCFSEDQGLMYFKKAKEFEKKYDYNMASKYYYESYKINKDEKILLKSARINQDIEKSVRFYNEFIKTFPSSRFRLLARYELANLYFMNNIYDKAFNEYIVLTKLAKGTIYFDKSVIKIANIYFIQNDYKNVIDFLFKNLNELTDYEAIANVNYLFGEVYLRQNNYDEAIHYFLIVAGSFPDSTKGAASLFELINIYILKNNFNKALKAYNILGEMYPDSFEKIDANKIMEKYKDKLKNIKPAEINLINNEISNSGNNGNQRIKNDFELSLKINIYGIDESVNKDNINESGFYIQLSYLSNEENAKRTIEDLKKNGITDAFYSPTKSSNSSKILFRVLIGPFENKEKASVRLIELKEKNIEAIILELKKEYE